MREVWWMHDSRLTKSKLCLKITFVRIFSWLLAQHEHALWCIFDFLVWRGLKDFLWAHNPNLLSIIEYCTHYESRPWTTLLWILVKLWLLRNFLSPTMQADKVSTRMFERLVMWSDQALEHRPKTMPTCHHKFKKLKFIQSMVPFCVRVHVYTLMQIPQTQMSTRSPNVRDVSDAQNSLS